MIVVEGFGYGYSDLNASERTNQNISTELHEVLTKLNIPRPYVLGGHSIAGFYLLDYANRYPAEVSAPIGIDPSVPKATEGPVELRPLQGPDWLRALAVTGVARAVVAVAPGFVEPDGNAFTADERERMRLMTSWNLGNQAVTDETARIGNNAAALRGVRYPDGLPVLVFVSGAGGVPEEPAKVASLEELLKNVQRHQIVPLGGGHYLHWTHAKPMAEAIRDFLAGRYDRAGRPSWPLADPGRSCPQRRADVDLGGVGDGAVLEEADGEAEHEAAPMKSIAMTMAASRG